jgi:hypothetical protein
MGEEMHDRLNAAEELVKAERYDEATEEFVWLWENIARVDPGMDGVRVSFMAKDIEELIGKHVPARQRFSEIRDRVAQLADANIERSRRPRFDWIVLNEVLSDPDRTLAWFDAVKDDARYASVLDSAASCLIPLLHEHQRFRDIGRIYKDPVGMLVKTHGAFQPPPHLAADPYPEPNPKLGPDAQRLMRTMLQELLAGLSTSVIEEAALMVTCLLAADRPADAEAVEREARRLDPSNAMRVALQKARWQWMELRGPITPTTGR